MSVIRPFEATDVLRFTSVQADPWTATYHNGYYASYLAQWPDFCVAASGAFDDSVGAYMISKHEPPPPDPQHHGHLTAMSVCPRMRGTGLARVFMAILERLSSDGSEGWPAADDPTDCVDAWFVDLFVRCNNHRAIDMYERLGYSVYRRVVDYYHRMEGAGASRDELDGFDMRKSMARDVGGQCVRANGRDTLVTPDQVWA